MPSYLLRNVTVRPLAVGALLAIGLCRMVCGANPNSREPMNPLDIHNATNGQAALSMADGLFTLFPGGEENAVESLHLWQRAYAHTGASDDSQPSF